MMTTTPFLVPRRRVSPLVSLGWSDFDRVFDQLWNGAGVASARGDESVAPRIDFSETDAEIRVAAELPGLEEKAIQVSLEDGVLTIRGERSTEQAKEDAKGVRHFETFRGKYERKLRLPSEVDADAVKAAYRNGILTVTLPTPPEAQPQVPTIPVTTGAKPRPPGRRHERAPSPSTARVHFASWKMIPSAMRPPLRSGLTPWRSAAR